MIIKDIEKYYHFIFDRTHFFDGHSHGGYEANIVLKGSIEVTCSDKVLELNTGDMAIWQASMFHRDRVVSKSSAEFIAIHFSAEEGCFPDGFLGFYRLSHSNLSLVHILDEEIRQQDGEISPSAKCLWEAAILRIKSNIEPIRISSSAAAEIYNNAVNFMSENLKEPLGINVIARYCGVCATSLKNVFKQYAGKGVKEYFLEMKMEKARELLLSGVSSKEAADILGFSSESYFSQCFKRENGLSAREYTKNPKHQL